MAADRPKPEPPSLRREDLRAHAVWLRRLAVSLVGSGALADDVTQETWAAAVAQPPDNPEAWRSWLRTVLRNCIRAWARADGHRGRRESVSVELEDRVLPSSEELLIRYEALAFVAEEVVKLDEPYRSTVLLCYAEDVRPTEVARRQGLPAGTVRWRLKQGLDQLRRRLEERYGKDRRAWSVALGLSSAGGSPLIGLAVKALAAAAVVLAVTGSIAWSLWLSVPAEVGRVDPREEPIQSAKLADAGSQTPESWPRQPVPLLVEAHFPEETRVGRM